MGDRGGGRETKGGSLKKSKKNPGSTAAKEKKSKSSGTQQTVSSPTPVLVDKSSVLMDCAVALESRQFDSDRDRVLTRAKQAGVGAVLVWFADVEKQEVVMEMCKINSGFCYAVIGIHPNNIDKTNKKMHEQWVAKVNILGLLPECVAIATGLNLSREMGTHFAQESVFRSCCQAAAALKLPIVLHLSNDGSSLDRALELLQEHRDETANNPDTKDVLNTAAVILYDAIGTCGGSVDKIRQVVGLNIFCMISASGLTSPDGDIRARAVACLKQIPTHLMLACTDAPWHTPQNLDDPHLQTLKNEPSNMPSVVKAIQESMSGGESVPVLCGQLFETSVKVFNIPRESDEGLSGQSTATTVEKAEDTSSIVALEVISDVDSTGKNERLSTRGGEKQLKEKDVYYGCAKCRARLLHHSSTLAHSLETTKRSKSKIKVGDEGLCSSFVFVPFNAESKQFSVHANDAAVSVSGTLAVSDEVISCAACSTKLGKLSWGPASCACGCMVPGPVGRLNTQKMDVVTSTPSDAADYLDEIVGRLESENAQIQLTDEQEDFNMREVAGALKMTKKEKKLKKRDKSKHIAFFENRGNYCVFRDKTFVSNASRGGSGHEDKAKGDDDAQDSDDSDEEDS